MSDHVDELLGLYALGGLEPDELENVEAHLEACPDCQREADDMRTLASLVAEAAPDVELPPEMRSRLLKRIAATRPRPAQRPADKRAPRWLPAALGALLVLALFGWNLSLNNQLDDLRQQVATQQKIMKLISSPATHAVELAGQGRLLAASGRAYIDQTSNGIVLITQHLRPLGPDETYQAWLIGEKGPVSAGLFRVNNAGWGMYTLDVPYTPGEFQAIGVSVEPAGGSQKPSEVVLVGGF